MARRAKRARRAEGPRAAAAFVARKIRGRPRVGIILGTGLGGLAGRIEGAVRIPYAKIPGMPIPTVESHTGELVCGRIGARSVAALEGRFHLYEGHPIGSVVFPVRMLAALGVDRLVVSAAVGGLNPQYRAGDVVLIEDHVNLMGANPLIGPNDERVGPRFPDMSAPYDPSWIDRAERLAMAHGTRAHRGVYVAVAGPNLETRAEYRFLRLIGADVVGMSVVPEVLAAVHAGLKVFGIAIVTDMCLPDALKPAKLEHILAVARRAEPKMTRLVAELIETA
jgi:purine-nucleoside phosphorylase